jgi:hypothetical protein
MSIARESRHEHMTELMSGDWHRPLRVVDLDDTLHMNVPENAERYLGLARIVASAKVGA